MQVAPIANTVLEHVSDTFLNNVVAVVTPSATVIPVAVNVIGAVPVF